MKIVLVLIGLAAACMLSWRTALVIGAFCGFNEREDNHE